MGENAVPKHCYPAAAMEVTSVELGHTAASKCYDDDGRLKRTGKYLAIALQSGLAWLLPAGWCSDQSPERILMVRRPVLCYVQGRCGQRARTLSRR
jgi:hypothetical protein